MFKERELTNLEVRTLQMHRALEQAMDKQKLTMTLMGNFEVAEGLQRLDRENIAKILKVDLIAGGSNKYIIVYALPEFRRYLDYMVDKANMRYDIEGFLVTHDGLPLE